MVLKWPFLSHEFSIFFFTKLQKQEMTKIMFYDEAFDSNKIQACKAHQNDCLKLNNFVKDINAIGQKMTRNGHKMANS